MGKMKIHFYFMASLEISLAKQNPIFMHNNRSGIMKNKCVFEYKMCYRIKSGYTTSLICPVWGPYFTCGSKLEKLAFIWQPGSVYGWKTFQGASKEFIRQLYNQITRFAQKVFG